MNCFVANWIHVIMTKVIRFLGVLSTESLLDPCSRSGFEKAFRGVARSGSAPRVARWGTAPGVARSGTGTTPEPPGE